MSKPARRKRGAPAEGGDLSDDALLDLVQQRTLRYFWDFAHPVSGLARDRSDPHDDQTPDTCAIGGTGFGVMTIIVGVERGWIPREAAVDHLLKLVPFLYRGSGYHGAWPHFMNGSTGRTIPFGRRDDGGDIVETSFMLMGLLCARQYFDRPEGKEAGLRGWIRTLWHEAEWNWFTQGGRRVLYWHWSPNYGWAMDHEIRGWNECLVTYVLAAGSPTYPIDPVVYHKGWAAGRDFLSGREHLGIKLQLGPPLGGPLFFTHYSFMGIDPHGLKDRYADYWAQNVAHVALNRAHCIANPHGWKGYGEACWGLTASDNDRGYDAHAPDNDLGVISPTAALSSFPYAPEECMRVLRHFYTNLGDRIWSDMGFVDAFSESRDWYAKNYIAIDQGPIVVMIENWRTGLLWRLFMSCPEVQEGLRRLGFTSPWLQAPAA
ncbi:MAG: glucoamylase family protein [Geminicoccaceae bacterium]